MHRFFIPPDALDGHQVTLTKGIAYQIKRVLRLEAGEYITALDNSGWEYSVKLERVDDDLVEGLVEAKAYSLTEPKSFLTLYQGILKANKFEWLLQKGTELGISRFVPLSCQRSVPKIDAEWPTAKYPRWQKIISEAAEQCRRGRLPTLEIPLPFFQGCDTAHGLSLILWEDERETSLKMALQDWQKGKKMEGGRISLFVGPEGGFTQEEVEYAFSKGILPVSLGRRILRAESAGLIASAAILYELGDLGDVS
ncbi:MAG: 16S rRNA (uracil(1498)-N(3))-methyltransferase [Chloroflexi bacterium]|nr:16S rRNA (uracil(1498)-N(3))-methyltransferase [Chloroflexota bacterium]